MKLGYMKKTVEEWDRKRTDWQTVPVVKGPAKDQKAF